MSTRSPATIAAAVALTCVALVLGYLLLGWLPMLLFAFGFVGGLALWLRSTTRASWRSIRVPYVLTLVAFVAHKLEERYLDFFPELAKITGVAVPDTSSPLVALLYAVALTWLLIPFLVKRGRELGDYLAWTFFTSMGITELAHFVFPLVDGAPGYRFFPGMASTVVLAPLAWWGLLRMRAGSSLGAPTPSA